MSKSKSAKGLHFQKQVPKFLQQYTSLLQINKKNYMNEEVGGYMSNEDDEFIDESIKRNEINSLNSSSSVITKEIVDVEPDFSNKFTDRDTTSKLITSSNNDEVLISLEDELKEKGPIKFQKRLISEVVDSKSSVGNDKVVVKKNKFTASKNKNSNLLSFEDECDN